MKTFYDLTADTEKRRNQAEDMHYRETVIRELRAIREATQSLCVLMMGVGVNVTPKKST